MILQLNRRSTRTVILAAAFGLVPVALLVPAGFAQVAPPTTAPAVAAAPAAAPAPTSQPAAAAAAVANSPTMIGLKQLLQDKNYTDLVKEASKLLATKNDPNVVISRFQVIMLKGEGQAGLKLTALAVDTFKSAAKETTDPREMALAYWTSELFHKSSALAYIPKAVGVGGARQDPIPLLDLSNRTAAFQALLDDQLAQLEPRIKAATTSQTLPTIMPVLEQVVELNHLDEIANGNDEKTAKVANSLLAHSKNLMVTAVKGMWNRVGDIETAANKPVSVMTTTTVNGMLVNVNGTHKTGLSRDNVNELHNIIDTCSKVHDASNAFLEMAKTDDGWSALGSDSDRVAGKANDLLNNDYTTVTPDLSNTTATGTNPNPNGTNTPIYINGQPVYPNNNNDTYLPGTSFPTNTPIPSTPNSGGTTPSTPAAPSAPTTPKTPSNPTTPATPTTPSTPTTPGNSTPSNPTTPPQQPPLPSRTPHSGVKAW